MARVEFKSRPLERKFEEIIMGTYFRIHGEEGIFIKSGARSFINLSSNSVITSAELEMNIVEISSDKILIHVYDQW